MWTINSMVVNSHLAYMVTLKCFISAYTSLLINAFHDLIMTQTCLLESACM